MLEIGDVFRHPKNKKLLYVISGQFERNGGISNYWEWRYVNKLGYLSRKISGGYDNIPFKRVESKIIIRVINLEVTR